MREIGRLHLRSFRTRRGRLLSRSRGLGDETGSALLELSIVVAFLGVPLLLGSAEMGYLAYFSVETSNSAHSGALYGMRSVTFAADTAGITTAAQAEATDIATLTVTPTAYYICSLAVGGTQYTGASGQSNATAACTGGSNHPLEFVQVDTSASVTPPIHCPGLPKTFTLNGLSVMEVEK